MFGLRRRLVGGGKKGSGLGTTLVFALVTVVLSGEKILVATGEVEAGVDQAEMGEDDVRVDGDRMTIDLLEPQILSSSLDEERTRVYDRDRGLFNLGADDVLVQEARQAAGAEVVATAEENGILQTAESNTEESIRAFVTTLGFEEVEFGG
jgi:hypothetical protein